MPLKEVLDEIVKMDGNYLKKRFLSLYETRKLSDCSFLIENETISSHKIILACSSPVFEAMLFGPMAVSTNIEIRDIPASEFKQMLDFIYTDTVQISSIINAWALVYIAKKYLIEDLNYFCLNYIKQNMRASNTLVNYEFADLFNEDYVRSLCLNTIQMYAKIILHSDYHIKPSTLCYLLDQNELNANEKDLLSITIKWATVECHRQNQDITKDNIRSVLFESGALSRIRFLSLPIEEINNKIFAEVLQDDEIEMLESCKLNESLENKSKLQKMNLSLNYNPRNNIELTQKLGLRRSLKSGCVFHANNTSKLTTKLQVNKCVLVDGFLLPTQRKPEKNIGAEYKEKINLTITDVTNKEVVRLSLVQTLCYDTIHTVKIPEPLLFEEGQLYEIDITWPEFLSWSNSNEYFLNYFTPCLTNKDLIFEFRDPLDCGFIVGICYYPI